MHAQLSCYLHINNPAMKRDPPTVFPFPKYPCQKLSYAFYRPFTAFADLNIITRSPAMPHSLYLGQSRPLLQYCCPKYSWQILAMTQPLYPRQSRTTHCSNLKTLHMVRPPSYAPFLHQDRSLFQYLLTLIFSSDPSYGLVLISFCM